MLKAAFVLVAVTVIALLMCGAASAQHYYGGGQEIPLQVDSSLVTIRFNPYVPDHQRDALIDSIGRIDSLVNDDHAIDDFEVFQLNTTDGYFLFLDSLVDHPAIDFAEPYYRNQYDTALLVGIHFCVAFNEGVSETEIDSINASNGVEISRPLTGMVNVYLLRNTPSSGSRLLDIASEYYVLPKTRYSHPGFSVKPELSSYKLYDYYADFQPHTKKVVGQFNSASVWDFAGLEEAVTVAVIDDGIDVHEDLPLARILPGWNFADSNSNTIPRPDWNHGIACAGILAASHTTDSIEGLLSNSGMISMYPSVNIRPVNIWGYEGAYALPPQVAEAIAYASQEGAAVLTCSWGYPRVGPGEVFDVINDALDRAYSFGRDGRGCVIVFSSGNYASSYSHVCYPANQPMTLAVGAVQLDDHRWFYSQYGPTLDLVAPSAYYCGDDDVWTLDQMGNLGMNPDVPHWLPLELCLHGQ